MSRELLYSVLGNDAFWLVNKKIRREIGNDAALLLADLIAKERYFVQNGKITLEGYFFNTNQNLVDDLDLSQKARLTAQKILVERGFVTVRKMGVPAKNYYRVESDQVVAFLSSSQSGTTTHAQKDTTTGSQSGTTLNKNKEQKEGRRATVKPSPEFNSIIESFNERTGLKVVPDMRLLRYYYGAAKRHGREVVALAIKRYAESTWHQRKRIHEKEYCWNLEKFLLSSSEIANYGVPDPHAERDQQRLTKEEKVMLDRIREAEEADARQSRI